MLRRHSGSFWGVCSRGYMTLCQHAGLYVCVCVCLCVRAHVYVRI